MLLICASASLNKSINFAPLAPDAAKLRRLLRRWPAITNMSYERPTKGNKQQLAIDQHFHTAHAIAKFYGEDENVEVRIVESNEIVKRQKRASIFCTKRTWDEKAERGYMSRIEKAFHEEIDHIKPYAKRNHAAISEYFLLWELRFKYHILDLADPKLGVEGTQLTKTQEEILEKKGYCFLRENGIYPSRFISSTSIVIDIDRHWPSLKDIKWGMLESKDAEFVVADSYKEMMLIPFEPRRLFAANFNDMTISNINVARINKESVASSTIFYFGKDLSKCPISL
jgi:hypothetical protein